MSRDAFDYEFDRYDEQECIEFERIMRLRRPQLTLVPAAVPARPPRRCHACGYAQGALGHQVSCLGLAGAA